MSKLTKWIKCKDQQPSLPGWYDMRHAIDRKYWDGEYWRLGPYCAVSAYGDKHDAWRGLSENPSAPKEAK